VWVAERTGPLRRTQQDLCLVAHGRELVCVDARVANRLAALAVERGAVEELAGWSVLRREVGWAGGRIDLLLGRGEARLWLEVKSVTLVEHGLARFPDAPTARGTRQMLKLAELAEQGGGITAAVWFLVLRRDAVAFAAHLAHDPAFAAALRRATGAGVRVLATTCAVELDGVRLHAPVPVLW
jgi:sugar fermentation stimulation protein A